MEILIGEESEIKENFIGQKIKEIYGYHGDEEKLKLKIILENGKSIEVNEFGITNFKN